MYYVLGEYDGPHRWIDDTPFLKGVSFWKGAIIDKHLPEPLEYSLKPQLPNADHGPKLPAYYDQSVPLFRDDLIAALFDFGVNNFDTYETTIFDPDKRQNYLNYKAVNILGLVAAANMEASEAVAHDGIPLIDVDFDKLVIDEKKTYGLMMFRLAQSVDTLLVHEKLRNYLEQKGFADDLQFWEPGEIAI